ncbi:hypothetical protein [Xanthomonas sacchari]|uniref:hypothetical protein n=1 Tax=Xanthomonas sacchari TaxID=56458 RepID=UPI00225E0EB7|nr:hypothetical protein [Xanthomonas sacchari]
MQALDINMDQWKLVLYLEASFAAYDATLAPPQDVVLAGLSAIWPSDYWAGLAIGWLEEGAPIDSEIAQVLDAMVKGPFSQSVRHRAFALARRWHQAHNV